MKKLLFILFIIGAFACTKNQGYKIEVNIEGAEGLLVLEKYENGKTTIVDSAEVVNGVATFVGEVTIPENYYLGVKGSRSKILLFVENSEISVSGKIDSIAGVVVEGSATNDEYKVVSDQMGAIHEEYMGLYKQSQEANALGDTAKAKEIMAQVEEVYKSAGKLQEDFVANNPASFVTPLLLSQIVQGKSVEKMDSMLSVLDPKLEATASIKAIRERVEKLRKVAVGQIAPDFTQNDPEGNPINFSDVYSANEYTLVDFWAAWCSPCRGENPNVVAVYNDYNAKGFTVFGVSLDRSKEDWLKAIEDDGLTWQHVSDLSYWSNAAAKLYTINSIPSNLLVDKTGKIIAKNLREEALREKISELLD